MKQILQHISLAKPHGLRIYCPIRNTVTHIIPLVLRHLSSLKIVKMEAADGAAGTLKTDMTDLSKSALLLVVGEPFTTDHRDLILKEITEGKGVV